MLYYTIIGIVCAVVAPVGTLGFRIKNETEMEESNRNFGNRLRRFLWVTSESFKLDLSDDFVEDFDGTREITTRSLKRRGIVRTNLKEVAADAEIDMNKRIEKLAREISKSGVAVEDSETGAKGEDDRMRMKRRTHKKRRRFMLNPFKRKPSLNERYSQSNLIGTTASNTPYMGIFERKMKEFRAQQRMKSSSKHPEIPITTEDGNYSDVESTEPSTEPSTDYAVQEESYKQTTSTTFLPPYVVKSTDYSLSEDDELSPESYLKIRHALRNYRLRKNGWSERGFHCRRRKRCNRLYFPYRRCKKSPPVVCLPFIKRGQDDVLKFLINVMQGMLDKSCNSKKPYGLDKVRCKSFRPEDTWESIDFDGQAGCETTTPCPKTFAILPFPLPFPPCTNVPVTLPPTTIPTCPPICFPTPPTTPVLPILPIPIPPPCPVICPDIPKSQPSDTFTPPTMIIPTYFAPWPTTKSPCIEEPCQRPINSNFEGGIVPHLNRETLPPWPTPPPFIKSSSHQRRIPIYRQLIEKTVDYPEVDRMDNREGRRKVNRFDFESVYDSPEQETMEQSDVDVRTRRFRYDPENEMDSSFFDFPILNVDQSKMKNFPRRNHRRRRPKTEDGRYRNGSRYLRERRYREPFASSRQKRDEVSGEDGDGSGRTTTVLTSTETENSNHRNEYDSFVDKKKSSTMRSGIIGRGPKRLSNHPQGKVFDKVYPESYSEVPAESSTTKNEKTTVSNGNGSSLMHLQLLAVCEGYLEMIERLKLNNQSRGEDELVRYCEKELSNGFDSFERKSIERTTPTTVDQQNQLESPTRQESIRNKVVVDILRSPVYREMRSHFLARNSTRYGNPERRRRRKKRRRGFRGRPFRRRTTENVDSIRLLRKSKGALVSWLFNKDDLHVEDEEEEGDGTTEIADETSTASVRRKETSATPQPDTVYPVYAKMYGYDKGGELSDIEVLLRSLNERNETREIAKNVTVLAMLMNPEEEERDTGLVEDGNSAFKHDAAKFGGKSRGEIDWKKVNASAAVEEEEEVNEMIEEEESTPSEVSSTDGTTILGHETTEIRRKNCTRNGTYVQAVSSAKELVKDYTIEFLNYAVYIIPIMFILLFLVCCLCFILKIMTHNRKKRKKGRGKRKVTTPPSSDTDSETSESSINRNQKKTKEGKGRSKKLWSAMRSKGNGDEDGGIARKWKRKRRKNGEGLDSEERKLMKRLRRKKKELEEVDGEENEERALVSDRKRVSYHDSNDTDEPDTRIERHKDSIAKERRELIALLEELKNLEDREKKESKSVFVQYVTADCENDESEMSFRQNGRIHDLDNFRRMSQDLRSELVRGNSFDVAYKFELLTRMIDSLPTGEISPRKKSVLMEEMENFRRRLGYRKYTKLKDHGVLCRP